VKTDVELMRRSIDLKERDLNIEGLLGRKLRRRSDGLRRSVGLLRIRQINW